LKKTIHINLAFAERLILTSQRNEKHTLILSPNKKFKRSNQTKSSPAKTKYVFLGEFILSIIDDVLLNFLSQEEKFSAEVKILIEVRSYSLIDVKNLNSKKNPS